MGRTTKAGPDEAPSENYYYYYFLAANIQNARAEEGQAHVSDTRARRNGTERHGTDTRAHTATITVSLACHDCQAGPGRAVAARRSSVCGWALIAPTTRASTRPRSALCSDLFFVGRGHSFIPSAALRPRARAPSDLRRHVHVASQILKRWWGSHLAHKRFVLMGCPEQ
jgi:hypothetical protein